MPSTNLRIPEALRDEVRRVAKANGTSLNAVAVRAFEDYIANTEWRDRALAAEDELRRLKGEQ
jgi:predicted transcriptional regulator